MKLGGNPVKKHPCRYPPNNKEAGKGFCFSDSKKNALVSQVKAEPDLQQQNQGAAQMVDFSNKKVKNDPRSHKRSACFA